MACLYTTGLTRNCGFSQGGLIGLWLLPKEQLLSVSKSSDNTITGITLTGATNFYEFEFEPNTGQFTQPLAAGSPSRFVNHTVNAQFTNINQASKEVLKSIANAYSVAIVKDSAGRYWLAGETGRGLIPADGGLTIDTGTAEGDGYIATLSLVGGSLDYANEITSAAALAVI